MRTRYLSRSLSRIGSRRHCDKITISAILISNLQRLQLRAIHAEADNARNGLYIQIQTLNKARITSCVVSEVLITTEPRFSRSTDKEYSGRKVKYG